MTYTNPKITYSEPKVTHSDPTHLHLPLPTSPEPEEAIISEVKLNFGWRRWWVLVVVDDNQI